MEPFADVASVAVDGDGFSGEGVADDGWDEFLSVLVCAVGVGAAEDHDGQAVGGLPGADEMFGGGLGSGVWGAGPDGGGFGEGRISRGEVAADLVCGNVDEAEIRNFGFGVRQTVAGGLEEDVGSQDVGMEEGGGVGDGAVNVGLCGKVEDGVGEEFAQGVADGGCVGDVGLEERVMRMVADVGGGFPDGGLGECVEVEDAVAVLQQEAAEMGADESRPACDQCVHGGWFACGG